MGRDIKHQLLIKFIYRIVFSPLSGSILKIHSQYLLILNSYIFSSPPSLFCQYMSLGKCAGLHSFHQSYFIKTNTKLTQGCTSQVVENMYVACEVLILISTKTSAYVRMFIVRAFSHTQLQFLNILLRTEQREHKDARVQIQGEVKSKSQTQTSKVLYTKTKELLFQVFVAK